MSHLIALQKQIRDNANELTDFMEDMKKWQREMKRKEEEIQNYDDKEVPPVRKKCQPKSYQENTSFENGNDTEWSQENDVDEEHTDPTTKRRLREQSLFEKQKGNIAVTEQRYKDAIYSYTEAINYFPSDATFYANRAFCFLKTNQIREAETDCTSALQLDETYVKAYHRRAMARIKLDQIDEARSDLKRALTYEPDNKVVINELNRLNGTKQDTEKKAKDSIKSSQKKEKDDTLCGMKKAFIISGNKNKDSVDVEEQMKQKAAEEKKKGNDLVKHGQWEKAEQCYTSAISLCPSDDVLYCNRSLCFLKMGRPKSALLDALKAIEINDKNYRAYVRKGMAFKALGQLEEARDAFLKALEFDLSNEDVTKELNKLNALITERKMIKLKEIKEQEDRHKKSDGPKNVTNGVAERAPDTATKLGEESKCKYEKTMSLTIEPQDAKRILSSVKKLPKHLYPSSDEEKTVKDEEDGKTKSEKADTDVLQEALREAAFSVQKNKSESITALDQTNCNSKTRKETLVPAAAPQMYKEFFDVWRSLDKKQRYSYLKKISGKQLPKIFQSLLETDMLMEILEVLASEFIDANEPVIEYLQGLTEVERFNSIVMFISDTDKENIRKLLNYCDKSGTSSKEELCHLRNVYLV